MYPSTWSRGRSGERRCADLASRDAAGRGPEGATLREYGARPSGGRPGKCALLHCDGLRGQEATLKMPTRIKGTLAHRFLAGRRAGPTLCSCHYRRTTQHHFHTSRAHARARHGGAELAAIDARGAAQGRTRGSGVFLPTGGGRRAKVSVARPPSRFRTVADEPSVQPRTAARTRQTSVRIWAGRVAPSCPSRHSSPPRSPRRPQPFASSPRPRGPRPMSWTTVAGAGNFTSRNRARREAAPHRGCACTSSTSYVPNFRSICFVGQQDAWEALQGHPRARMPLCRRRLPRLLVRGGHCELWTLTECAVVSLPGSAAATGTCFAAHTGRIRSASVGRRALRGPVRRRLWTRLAASRAIPLCWSCLNRAGRAPVPRLQTLCAIESCRRRRSQGRAAGT